MSMEKGVREYLVNLKYYWRRGEKANENMTYKNMFVKQK